MNEPLPVLPARPLPAAHRVALRRELLATVRTSASPHRYRRRRVYAATGLAVAVVAGGGGAVAYSQLGSAPVTDHSSARCYTQAHYQPGHDFPGTTIAVPDYSSSDGKITRANGVQDALSSCADLFRQGFLQVGSSHVPAIDHPGPAMDLSVPALVECVLPDGTAAVFPGSTELCAHLGLAQLAPR